MIVSAYYRYAMCKCGARVQEDESPRVAMRGFLQVAPIKVDVNGRALCPWCLIPFPRR